MWVKRNLRVSSRRTAVAVGSVIAAVAVAVSGAVAGAEADPQTEAAGQNIVMIMTDDQAKHYLHVMPNVQQLAANGATFSNMYATYPLCCPSRATYVTGQHGHNHKVLDNTPTAGGYAALRRTQLLPHWLDSSDPAKDYHTAHIGKYLNGYGSADPQEVPPGWDEWHGLVGGSTYQMWGYKINHNGNLRQYGVTCGTDPSKYQTDVLSGLSTDFIGRRATASKPFFLSVASLAPHVENDAARACPNYTQDPRPAPRHAGRFSGKTLPRPYTFNEADVSDKPAFAVPGTRMSETRIAQVRRRYQAQLESLLAVDELVGKIVDKLRATGQLANTTIMFTSDNGYFNGEHRVPGGKKRAYPASARLPMVIKGPGIPSGVTRSTLVSNVDWAPTILDVANRPRPTDPRYLIDGRSLIPLAQDPTLGQQRELLFITGPRSDQGETWYKAIRTKRYHYIEHLWWNDGAWRIRGRELYDLSLDKPYLTSLQNDPRYDDAQLRMAAKLHDLDDCSGADCLHSSV